MKPWRPVGAFGDSGSGRKTILVGTPAGGAGPEAGGGPQVLLADEF